MRFMLVTSIGFVDFSSPYSGMAQNIMSAAYKRMGE